MTEEAGEGKQLQLLRVTLRNAIEDVVKSFQDDELLLALADVPHIKKSKLKGLIECFKQSVLKDVNAKIENVISTEEFDKLLRQREEMIQQQKHVVDIAAWRPSGSVTEDIRAHDMVVLKNKADQLSVLCEAKEKEANEYFDMVSEVRKKVFDCQNKLSRTWSKLREMGECVESQKKAHLRTQNSINDLSCVD